VSAQETLQTDQSAEKRDSRGRFAKGGAPKSPGRPAVARDFKQWCRAVLEEGQAGKPPAREQILDMLESGGEDRRFALRLLVEYGYGKPTQPVDLNIRQLVTQRATEEGLDPDEVLAEVDRMLKAG
jgi:hypothetical protein